MRNFFPTNSPVLFDRMFGKGARQIQANPSDNLEGCCCNCKEVKCKGCIHGHVITPDAGACHTPNNGVIFQYKRPNIFTRGMLCNTDCRQKVCCRVNIEGASDVKFYYNYIGQYFHIDYAGAGKLSSKWPQNGRPRLCSYCDPTSSDINRSDDPFDFPYGNETCLDFKKNEPDVRLDDVHPGPGVLQENFGDYPCSNGGYPGPIVNEISYFKGCQCMGSGLLEDPNDTGKRLSKYRKRQMEKDPYYRWLLDIMCYDNGNVIASPYYEYNIDPNKPGVYKQTRYNGGTLYDHLIGVVHCEHWYEISRCNEEGLNPEHGDGDLLGPWLRDQFGNPVGANLGLIAPRFWVYACSGVPLFDFEIEDAKKRYVDGQPLINEKEIAEIERSLALKETPTQALMDKLAAGGYLSTFDWRSEALSEIRILKGLTYTKNAYGGDILGDPEYGACCYGASGDIPPSCMETTGYTCGLLQGTFNPLAKCTSELCVTCSGFKPSSGLGKYLGPVRKRLWIPTEDGGVNFRGVTKAAWLDPKKARKNTFSSLMQTPNLAISEKNVSSDETLVNLQLPDDLIKDPWGGSYPAEPIGSEIITEEYQNFVTWRESQWLYMHARPGGWDYVCSAFNTFTPDPNDPNPQSPPPLRIPNIRRKFSSVGDAYGGCLDGVLGRPRRRRESSGGCEDVYCGEGTEDYTQAGCNDPCSGGIGVGLDCEEGQACPFHPEHGGGKTPCAGVAYESNKDGIRWLFYQQASKQNLQEGPSSYMTCNHTNDAFLYRVNIDAGNYSNFCPHQCRTKQIPDRIANAVPVVFSNRAAHSSLCLIHFAYNNYQGNPDAPPAYFGTICPGLFCKEHLIGNSPAKYNYVYDVFETACCNFRTNGDVANAPPSNESTHPASDRRDCPLRPGPPCFSPQCDLYDGRFVGTIPDWDPKGCCWRCEGPPYVPGEYIGIRTFSQCQEINMPPDGPWDGRGFVYPDQINSFTQCNLPYIGNCACGVGSSIFISGGGLCSPTDTEGETEGPG